MPAMSGSEAEAAQAFTANTLARLQGLYAEYASGNRAAVLDALADDVLWISVGNAEVPWGGSFHGRAGVEDYFARIDAAVQVTGYAVDQVVAQGEWVVALGRCRIRVLANGTEHNFAKADVTRLRDGRIAEFREFYDTAGTLAALRATRPPA
jgi:uncharacterized protein